MFYFNISVSAPTADELFTKVTEQLIAAGVVTPVQDSAAVPEPYPVPTEAPKTRRRKAEAPAQEEVAAAPVGPTSASTPAPAASEAPAAAEPPPAPTTPSTTSIDAEAVRVQIRTLLTPLMAGSRAADARALVAEHGSISKTPVEALPALLAAAQELAVAA